MYKKTFGLIITLLLVACQSLPQKEDEVSPHTGYIPQIIVDNKKVKVIYHGPIKEDEKWYLSEVNGKLMYTYGEAVVPTIQSAYLLEYLEFRPGDIVLDLGTGTGIQALFAAWSGKTQKIVATDIGPDAITSTRRNVKDYGLEKTIDIRQGDLFAPLGKGEKFSLIINNINYPEEKGDDNNPLWEVHERFFKEVKKYLLPHGRILYQTGHIHTFERIRGMVEKNGLVINEMKMRRNASYDKNLTVYFVGVNPFPKVNLRNKGVDGNSEMPKKIDR